MVTIPRKHPLSDTPSRAYELLELIAVSGEFPIRALARLPSGLHYARTIVTSLKRQGLIKTYSKNHLHGLRLTIRCKNLLLADNPIRFSLYLTGNIDTNHIRYSPERRERLYRMAEVTLTMKNAGVSVFRDERPMIFSPTYAGNDPLVLPAFYNTREIQESGTLFTKTKGARYIGVLLTTKDIFVTYNTGSAPIKWEYRAELRVKSLMVQELCMDRFPSRYYHGNVKGLVFGNSMETAYEILVNKRKNYFLLDDNYNHFHFLTNDRYGETILRLLCHREYATKLDAQLTAGLLPAKDDFSIDNDAMTATGMPVLLAYTCNLKRIRRFSTALGLHQKKGILICFDFQADALRRFCGENAEIQTLDFDETERRLFTT